MENTTYYDFHIHSCLSPCADDDMTPNNIINMAVLAGLDAVAITDHNSCKNCRAAAEVAKNAGILLVPGMELETSESIHVVCLFSEVDAAESFSCEVYKYLPDIKNKERIYGNQIVCDENDNPTGREEKLLVNSTEIGIYDVQNLCSDFGGTAILAHIDRHSNGVLGVLGDIDPAMGFCMAETSNLADPSDYKKKYPFLKFISDSDAHQLWKIQDPSKRNCLNGKFDSATEIIDFLRKK